MYMIVLGHGDVLDDAGDATPPLSSGGGGETERMWATSQDGWVITYDAETLATALCSNGGGGGGAGRRKMVVVLPSFGRTPPADGSCCTLSGDPTDGGGFTVVIIEPPEGSALWYCHVGSSSAASAKWHKVEYDVETLLS
uniref:Uncharacterized protein n=1 Tax=Oryza nivara TaxID=4536 RepID=A0A0E0HKK7_ORYNI